MEDVAAGGKVFRLTSGSLPVVDDELRLRLASWAWLRVGDSVVLGIGSRDLKFKIVGEAQ